MLDGKATLMMRANFGMLAAPVQAGQHLVELRFQLPGQKAGLWLGLLGVGLLMLTVITSRRFRIVTD